MMFSPLVALADRALSDSGPSCPRRPARPVHELYWRSPINPAAAAAGWKYATFCGLIRLTASRARSTVSVLPSWRLFRCEGMPDKEATMSDRYAPGSYGQFCPVAMAAEIVCSRWTALVLRELLCGTTRFNDLRRGVPLMSPDAAVEAPQGAGGGRRDRHRADRPAGRRRVQADRGRRGPAPRGHVARHLGPALGGVVALAQEPRPVAADVGHAPQPRPDAAAAQAHAPSISCFRSSRRRSDRGGW